VHKHYEHVDANEYAKGSEERWIEFKETIDTLVHKSEISYKSQEPLIDYLESEITQANVFPQELRYVSTDYKEVVELSGLVNTSFIEIENIIKNKNAEELILKEINLEEYKNIRQRLMYLENITDEILYNRFLPALKLPGSFRPFKGFNQDHRDSLARLRYRALASS
jgi:hypothetical protein